MMRPALHVFFLLSIVSILLITGGCANIIPPTGGPRDTIPPVLVSATPPDSAKNAKPTRIVLTFNEYLEQIQNPLENVIISPTLENVPSIESRLKTVTIRLKDTLEPNTTYSINFGKSIRDVNESNALEDFTYVFSTGSTIDENTLSGKVILAETGKVDSTLIAVLHRDLSDTAIIKNRPRYYTRLDGSGNFTFYNLPAGKFAVYVVENGYYKNYNDSTKLFAFLNAPVTVSDTTPPVMLYAYREAKPKPANTPSSSGGGGRNTDRRLRYSNPEGTTKDVLSPLQLDFVRKLKTFDSTKFLLTDTSFNSLSNFRVVLDSNMTRVSVIHPWKTGTKYKLIIRKDAVADADGVTLTKADTLTITTRQKEDYGEVRIRFNNLDMSKNPVLQIVQNDVVIDSSPITGREFRREIFKPGEYELRLLFDENNNGTWDPGNFKLKKQPEKVQSLTRKLAVRANWENEEEITL